MEANDQTPNSLTDAIRYYSDERSLHRLHDFAPLA